jgi:hypothetical protein
LGLIFEVGVGSWIEIATRIGTEIANGFYSEDFE